jgi:hypothetical protein
MVITQSNPALLLNVNLVKERRKIDSKINSLIPPPILQKLRKRIEFCLGTNLNKLYQWQCWEPIDDGQNMAVLTHWTHHPTLQKMTRNELLSSMALRGVNLL